MELWPVSPQVHPRGPPAFPGLAPGGITGKASEDGWPLTLDGLYTLPAAKPQSVTMSLQKLAS